MTSCSYVLGADFMALEHANLEHTALSLIPPRWS